MSIVENYIQISFETFCIFAILGASLSIISSIILSIFINTKKSTYAKMLHYICIGEAIFVFSQLIICLDQETQGIRKFFCAVENKMLFGNVHSTDYCYITVIINKCLFYSMQAFSLLLNSFICLETTISLRNPISKSSKRIEIYKKITIFIITASSIEIFFEIKKSETFDGRISLKERLFHSNALSFANLFFFIIYFHLGFISIIYLIFRFCRSKGLASNLTRKFVFQHSIYYLFYILFMFPYYLNFFLYKINSPFFYYEYCLLWSFFVGFGLFFVRASETVFYSSILKFLKRNNEIEFQQLRVKAGSIFNNDNEGFFSGDQPLTARIYKTMNLEFMCCILYGLTEIFTKKTKRQKDYNFNALTKDEVTLGETLLDSTASVTSPGKSKKIRKGDYRKAKFHSVIYSKIYEEAHDVKDIKVEILPNESNDISDSNVNTEQSQDSTFKKIKSKRGNIDQDAKIIEYCPKIFTNLREIDEIKTLDLEISLNPYLNKENISNIKESQGKSGSFFFFSHDNKFLIKTVTESELKTILADFVENYHKYLIENKESLLARIYGVYTVNISGVSKINIILMQNLLVFPNSHLKRIFDLKGSRVERFTKEIQKADKFKTLKDLDYLWMIDIEENLIDFDKDIINELEQTLYEDVKLLRELQLMDYSLLLIIIKFPDPHDTDYQNIINLWKDPRYKNRIFKSANKKYIYCMGVIDYLQKFNLAKFFENKYKSLVYGNKIKYVSAVDPMVYANRLVEFCRSHVFITHRSHLV